MITISIIYRCLFTIVLCLLNFTQWFHQRLVQFFNRHRYTIRVNIDVTRTDSKKIFEENLHEKIQLNKRTDVIAMIINETISDQDLGIFIVNSIIFFRKFNIQHLIIYDYQGYIKAQETSIMNYVHTYDKKFQSSSLPLTNIHFLSLLDCSQTLTKVTQTICQQVKQGELNIDTIQIETVDQYYTKIATIPDINLALVVGPISSSLGLHPWLTRLTEFIMIDSYKQMQTTNAYLNIVQRYNRIEQRQGR